MPVATFPSGRWVIAGTPVSEPYPCRCERFPCRYYLCPCRGRSDDLGTLPKRCCALVGQP